MAKAKSSLKYICENCESTHATYMGRCNKCGKWNTIVENKEVIEAINEKKSVSNKSLATCSKGRNIARNLNEVEANKNFRLKTGIEEFDRVMGGGVVKNSVTIITAPPGAVIYT